MIIGTWYYPSAMRDAQGSDSVAVVTPIVRVDKMPNGIALSGDRCACVWCGQPFKPRRTGGSPQRFCLPAHRRAFDMAARRYVDRLIAAGRVSIADLHAPPAARAGYSGLVGWGCYPQVAETARSRSVSPIRIVWAEPPVGRPIGAT